MTKKENDGIYFHPYSLPGAAVVGCFSHIINLQVQQNSGFFRFPSKFYTRKVE